jgi:hypothetical protein
MTPAELGSICVVIVGATDVEATNALDPPVEQVTSSSCPRSSCACPRA